MERAHARCYDTTIRRYEYEIIKKPRIAPGLVKEIKN
jgi:hypothetical protein